MTSTPAARRACRSGWCRPPEITASSPDEKDAFFDPAADKVYRHPTFYEVPEARRTYERAVDDAALGDDALIAAQRLAEWCSRAPELEEDIALANIALDQLGAARLLLTLRRGAESRQDRGRPRLPAHRPRVPQLPAGRAARTATSRCTMVKLLFLSAYQKPLYEGLVAARRTGSRRSPPRPSRSPPTTSTTRHCGSVRLGDGTEESHRRAQAAVDDLWPYTHELFEPRLVDGLQGRLARPTWSRARRGHPDQAGRRLAARPAAGSGVHTEHLSRLLAEMQVLHRAHPGATW